MKKETQVEGLQKTTFINEEMDKKVGIKQELNVAPHLKANKELYKDKTVLIVLSGGNVDPAIFTEALSQ